MSRSFFDHCLFFVVCLGSMVWSPTGAQPAISDGKLSVTAFGQPEHFLGFTVTDGSREVARVTFGSVGNIIAARADALRTDRGPALRFRGLHAVVTPTIGRESHITVRLPEGFEFPLVEFRLELGAFIQSKWERSMGSVPFHFLCLRMEGAGIFHQRGWSIPTPVLDPYPLRNKGTGYGRQIVSNWSGNWTYAPPLGAHPVAVAGLWAPADKRYAGFDFHAARLTDHGAKNIGTTYCWKFKDTGQFIALAWPYARPYQDLRFPENRSVVESRFHLLYSLDMASDDDPNLLVTRFIWKHFADLMPGVPRMNDLSWLPADYRLDTFPKPSVGRLFRRIRGTEKRRWWKGGTLDLGGITWDGDPVTYIYETKQTDRIAQLKEDITFLLAHAKRFKAAGDDCVYWMKPLEGEAIDMFGPEGVPTIRNIQSWQVALALLDVVRNEPRVEARMLPYVDGALRFTKHILTTRNGYADVPCAQFCWGAGPVTTFCLRYYYTFRNDPRRRELSDLAHKLAHTMLYRYLPIWCSDSDETDDLDSSFLLEPNSGISWLGAACSNEVWVLPHAVAQVYVATGDPVLGHYLRGMLERWHELYRDEYRPEIAAYGNAFTERLGLFDGSAQPKGTRAAFGGLWGMFERYGWPIGKSSVRVLCGEAAAIAFNKKGKHTDIAEYRSTGEAQFSFRLVPLARWARPPEPFDVCVTFPYFDLRKKQVQILRKGQLKALKAGVEYSAFDRRPDSLYLRALRYGDVVAVGGYDPAAPIRPCRIAKVRAARGSRTLGEYRTADIRGACNRNLEEDWDNVRSWAGLDAGLRWLYSVPFDLIDPLTNGGRRAARNTDIPIHAEADAVFALVAEVEPNATLVLRLKDGLTKGLEVRGAVPARKGWPPSFEWHVDLVYVNTGGAKVDSLEVRGASVLAVSLFRGSAESLSVTLAALDEKRAKVAEELKQVAAIRKLAPLFERCSGHIALLPQPELKNPYSLGVVKLLQKAGVMKHVKVLTSRQLASSAVFNARRFWVALYLGGEGFYETVQEKGDGLEAVRRFLGGGGTLALLPTQPFPFYYNERGEAVVAARKIGLPINGSGFGKRPDTLKEVSANGWERPPNGVRLAFQRMPGQRIITSGPDPIEFPAKSKADPRWRPIVGWVAPGDRYIPALTLRDPEGKSYGEGVGLVEFKKGKLAGGRILYVWCSLLKLANVRVPVLSNVLRFVLDTATPPPARALCPRALQAPVIDGRQDDPVWRALTPVGEFTCFGASRGAPKFRTEAKWCWDDRNLYLGFTCEDPDIWSTITQRDGHLWEGEVVEAYIDPDGDGRNYKEFEVNPHNAVIDLNIEREEDGRVADPDKFARWNAVGWRAAVHLEGTVNDREDHDRRWTVEMAIPMSNFTTAKRVPPRVGDSWRVQLLRIERPKGPAKPEFSAWSPTDTFHRPVRFGRLVFAGPALSDDFSLYPEGSDGRPNWAVQAGKWHIEKGELVGEGCGTDGWRAEGITWGQPVWHDYTFRARFRIEGRGSDWRDGPWFGVRCDGNGNGYYLNFSARDVELHKVSQGRSTGDRGFLATSPFTPDSAWHALEVSVRGATIEAKLDGKPLLNVLDHNPRGLPPLESGNIIFAARQYTRSKGNTRVRYDDVSVKLER